MQTIENRFKNFLEYSSYEYKEHQAKGVSWCTALENNKLSHQNIHGGIIADEMGCGKTVMMIGLMFCNFVPKTLIVVPLALLDQWKKSIYELTCHHPLVYYGNSTEKVKICLERGHAPIVLTTYGMLTHKYDKPGDNIDVLFKTNWDRVIYDEAHHMRNANTKKYISGKAVQSKIKWLLTGTPIQNKMSDLYNLCTIIGISKANKLDIKVLQENILKRTKESVGIKLPSLLIHEEYIDWANEDEKMLSTILHSLTVGNVSNQPDSKHSIISDSKNSSYTSAAECIESYEEVSSYHTVNALSDEKHCRPIENECIVEQETQQDISSKMKSYIINILGDHYLPYFLRCRQMCVCPKLLSKLQSNYRKSELNDPSIIENALKHMNKIDHIVNIIKKNYQNNNKKIIFCQYREEMDIIKKELTTANITNVEIYDGRMSRKQRTNILERMPNILILQIQMGCEGLNLQYANEVYFVGPLWNPAVVDQAIGRCYRLGQEKETNVYRFLMKDICYKEETTSCMDSYMTSTLEGKRDLQVF